MPLQDVQLKLIVVNIAELYEGSCKLFVNHTALQKVDPPLKNEVVKKDTMAKRTIALFVNAAMIISFDHALGTFSISACFFSCIKTRQPAKSTNNPKD